MVNSLIRETDTPIDIQRHKHSGTNAYTNPNADTQTSKFAIENARTCRDESDRDRIAIMT